MHVSCTDPPGFCAAAAIDGFTVVHRTKMAVSITLESSSTLGISWDDVASYGRDCRVCLSQSFHGIPTNAPQDFRGKYDLNPLVKDYEVIDPNAMAARQTVRLADSPLHLVCSCKVETVILPHRCCIRYLLQFPPCSPCARF